MARGVYCQVVGVVLVEGRGVSKWIWEEVGEILGEGKWSQPHYFQRITTNRMCQQNSSINKNIM